MPFTIVAAYHRLNDSTVTFEWEPAPSDYDVTAYRIRLVPQPDSVPSLNILNALQWNLTLVHNWAFTATLTAVNCAGEGDPTVIRGIEICK